MEATIVDIRYKMREILRALERNEKVQILYHGKRKGVIIPSGSVAVSKKINDHPFFGMIKRQKKSVSQIMKELRKARHNDL